MSLLAGKQITASATTVLHSFPRSLVLQSSCVLETRTYYSTGWRVAVKTTRHRASVGLLFPLLAHLPCASLSKGLTNAQLACRNSLRAVNLGHSPLAVQCICIFLFARSILAMTNLSAKAAVISLQPLRKKTIEFLHAPLGTDQLLLYHLYTPSGILRCKVSFSFDQSRQFMDGAADLHVAGTCYIL